jgi:cystathionine gamma-synthase
MLTDSRSAPGAIISIELRGPLEPVYDALRVPKGPSFGTLFTMACPFLYLAHYDLVSTQAGRACLIDNGLNPELLRLSIGTEDADDIIAVLDEALSAGEWR